MLPRLLIALIAIPLGLDLYLPVPEDNPMTQEKVALGRQLFLDRRLSRDGSIACATCYNPNRAFFWDGRMSTLEEQVLKPIQDPNEMDLTLEEASARVKLDSKTIARALASYVRSILSGDSPYDRFVNGERRALLDEQRLGLEVFRGKGNCTTCHVGPNFTDEQFHNTGVAWRDGRLADEGRFVISRNSRDHGAFKTPTLREVARTAPYMHDGSLATLENVIEFYSEGGRENPHIDPEIRPRHFPVEEKHALIAFLRSLTGRVQEGIR